MIRKIIILISITALLFTSSACKLSRNLGLSPQGTQNNTEESRNKPLEINTSIPPDVDYIKDVIYGSGGGRPLKLNILCPTGESSKPLPVIVWIHGGGWNSGSKDDYNIQLSSFAQRGYFVACIEYRFSTEAKFPAQIQDCKCAVRFLRAKAKEYNIDPNRIAAWGASAGGHLGALLGTTADIKEFEGDGGWNDIPSNVQAVCDWYGPTDFMDITKYTGFPIELVLQLVDGSIMDLKEKGVKASPTTYVTKGDSPFLIMHGDNDTIVPISQSQILYDHLKESDVNAIFHIVAGGGHGFGGIDEMRVVKDFLDKQLK